VLRGEALTGGRTLPAAPFPFWTNKAQHIDNKLLACLFDSFVRRWAF
jgi:hypothetical protein